VKILCVDVGTGTQDIFLYDSRLALENGFKLVLPSPTMMMYQRIRAATAQGLPIVLTGRQMGGGPSAWAAARHAQAGLPVYATPDAAITLDDELEKVSALGVRIISEDEARGLKSGVVRLEFKDFDFAAIESAFGAFGVGLHDLDAVSVAVFDHGAAPAGVSDRQFRFDYLDRRIRERNSLSAFAYLAGDVPPIMSRLRAVAESGRELDRPLIVMDTAPAAILGATYDPVVRRMARSMIVNIGNFHTLAFRMASNSIEGIFEHHTGEIDLPTLESLLRALAAGTLRYEDVFDDMGHGALIYGQNPLVLGRGDFDVVVTGPRRALFLPPAGARVAVHDAKHGRLRPYFAVPFGDMMIAGCFGLLAATAEVLPASADAIHQSMQGLGGGHPPWELD
jgi:uncharacterized protein (DUF1786 family)